MSGFSFLHQPGFSILKLKGLDVFNVLGRRIVLPQPFTHSPVEADWVSGVFRQRQTAIAHNSKPNPHSKWIPTSPLHCCVHGRFFHCSSDWCFSIFPFQHLLLILSVAITAAMDKLLQHLPQDYRFGLTTGAMAQAEQQLPGYLRVLTPLQLQVYWEHLLPNHSPY